MCLCLAPVFQFSYRTKKSDAISPYQYFVPSLMVMCSRLMRILRSMCCGCQVVSKDLDALHDEYIRLRERILKQLDGIPADSEQAKYLRSQLDYINLRIGDLQGLNNSYFNR